MKFTTKPYHTYISVHQVIRVLTLGCLSHDKCVDISDKLHDTWVGSFFNWIEVTRNAHRISIRVDKHDTYSMDATLAHVIVPMLIQLRDTTHGSALVQLEDIPIVYRPAVLESDTDQIHDNWRHVLNEMIWGFTQLQDTSKGEEQFYLYNPHDLSELRTLEYTMKHVDVDREGLDAYNKRIQNALVLFAKYYRNLWD